MKQKTEVTIAGKRYSIVGDEKADYIKKIAQYVDDKMAELMNQNNELTQDGAAVLTAINIADEYFKAEENADSLRKQIVELMQLPNKKSN